MIRINESHVTIMVQDMDRAISFYENIGLQLKNRWDNHYAIITAAGISIGLHPAGPGEHTPNDSHISIGFMIDNADEAKTLLDKHHIQHTDNDGKSGIYLHFKDPDGTILYFTQPKWK